MNTLLWVLGAGGMLGSAITRAAERRPGWDVLDVPKLTWDDPERLDVAVRGTARALVETARLRGIRWSIAWAAGATVTGASEAELEAEFSLFRSILTAIGEETQGRAREGSLFLASSVGGVYGRSVGPPFTESTEPVARSGYGRFKLRLEAEVRDVSANFGLSALVGRITNLYGPGQRLGKMQGLISHLALARFARAPVSIFVPLETTRDYVYVDDCASLILASLDELSSTTNDGPRVVTKILGSGQGVSISALLGYVHALGKAPLRVVLGSSASAADQAIDLRTRSEAWPHLDRFEKTPLPAGFHATSMDILRTLQREG